MHVAIHMDLMDHAKNPRTIQKHKKVRKTNRNVGKFQFSPDHTIQAMDEHLMISNSVHNEHNERLLEG